MKDRFVVQTTLSRADTRALARQQLGKNMLFMWFCLALLVIGTVVNFLRGGDYTLLYAIAAVVLVVPALFMDRLMGALMYRNADKSAGETSYTFTPADIYVKSKNHEGGIPYDAFMEILETDARFFLCIQKRMAFVLPKADFTQGDIDAFRIFLAEKTGKTIRKVRG